MTTFLTFYEIINFDEFVKSRNSIEYVIPANPGSGPGQAPESRVPGENRDPAFDMVPDFRRDDVRTPAFAGETTQKTFCEIINIGSSFGSDP